jgi:hypothetical protein
VVHQPRPCSRPGFSAACAMFAVAATDFPVISHAVLSSTRGLESPSNEPEGVCETLKPIPATGPAAREAAHRRRLGRWLCSARPFVIHVKWLRVDSYSAYGGSPFACSVARSADTVGRFADITVPLPDTVPPSVCSAAKRSLITNLSSRPSNHRRIIAVVHTAG